jgi:hypothetical protein
MALPTPQNCRMSPDNRGVLFEVEIDGRMRKGFITTQAIGKLSSAQADSVRAVSTSSEISIGLVKRIAAGLDDKDDPILLKSTMLEEKGRWTI